MDRSAAPARPPGRPPPRTLSTQIDVDRSSARPRPAGFWLRFWAWLVDSAILAIVLALLSFLVKLAFGIALVSFVVGLIERGLTGSFGAILAMLAFFVGWLVTGLVVWFLGQFLGWLYYAFFESSASRATPGKQLLRLWVVDAQNEQISFWRATVRHVFKFAALLPALVVLLFMVGRLADPKGPGSAATTGWLLVATLAAAPVLFAIFYGMAGWTRDRRALHDMLSGCYVVRSAELTPGRAFGLAVGSVAFFLIVWIVLNATFSYRSTSTPDTRVVTDERAAKPMPARPDATTPRARTQEPAATNPPATSTPPERAARAAATLCDSILAAHPDSILGPVPVVIEDAPGKMCKVAATSTKEAPAIRVEVGAAHEFRAREAILREYKREPSPEMTMREVSGLGDRAIVRIQGNGRFVTYFVLRGDKTIEIEFWQVTSHDADRARTIVGRLLEQIS
jgi:uncharacterized RDD family membrane protein YckC